MWIKINQFKAQLEIWWHRTSQMLSQKCSDTGCASMVCQEDETYVAVVKCSSRLLTSALVFRYQTLLHSLPIPHIWRKHNFMCICSGKAPKMWLVGIFLLITLFVGFCIQPGLHCYSDFIAR